MCKSVEAGSGLEPMGSGEGSMPTGHVICTRIVCFKRPGDPVSESREPWEVKSFERGLDRAKRGHQELESEDVLQLLALCPRGLGVPNVPSAWLQGLRRMSGTSPSESMRWIRLQRGGSCGKDGCCLRCLACLACAAWTNAMPATSAGRSCVCLSVPILGVRIPLSSNWASESPA